MLRWLCICSLSPLPTAVVVSCPACYSNPIHSFLSDVSPVLVLVLCSFHHRLHLPIYLPFPFCFLFLLPLFSSSLPFFLCSFLLFLSSLPFFFSSSCSFLLFFFFHSVFLFNVFCPPISQLLFQDLLHLLSTLSVNFPEGKGSWTDCSFRLRNVVMTG
eukprot:m.121531 g.121531  ORF g.121531 m.121531 type:complete len:158 (+) comp15523_c6_seq2:998-1471(+)